MLLTASILYFFLIQCAELNDCFTKQPLVTRLIVVAVKPTDLTHQILFVWLWAAALYMYEASCGSRVRSTLSDNLPRVMLLKPMLV